MDINCGASGKPEPTVKWYSYKYPNSKNAFLKCNHTLIFNFKRFYSNYIFFFSLAGHVLRIKNATRHMTKKYECIADNGVNPSLSRTFTLTVNCKLKFEIFNYHLNFSIHLKRSFESFKVGPIIKHLDVSGCRENDQHHQHQHQAPSAAASATVTSEIDAFARLSCHVSSSPRATIKWNYDGKELDDRRKSSLVDGLFVYEIHESATKGTNSVSRLLIKVKFQQSIRVYSNFFICFCFV